MHEFIQVSTTSDQKETLQEIAQNLVDLKLAACVQIGGPIESVYRWQGKVETANEWTCSIKSVRTLFPLIQKLVQVKHNYDEPQIIVVPIIDGSKAYLDWLNENCKHS